jgi:hypothetical protein
MIIQKTTKLESNSTKIENEIDRTEEATKSKEQMRFEFTHSEKVVKLIQENQRTTCLPGLFISTV